MGSPSYRRRGILLRIMASLRRTRSCEGYPLGHLFVGHAHGSVHRWESRCVSRHSALFFRRLTLATSAIWSLAVSTDRPVVAVFLLFPVRPARSSSAEYPIATKRVLRAILKAVDLCVSDPERSAQLLVDRRVYDHYDYALQHAERNPLRRLARLRSRGHTPLLRTAHARSGIDQVRARRSSSPITRIGVSSTNSSAS